jgi:hypothetical protein
MEVQLALTRICGRGFPSSPPSVFTLFCLRDFFCFLGVVLYSLSPESSSVCGFTSMSEDEAGSLSEAKSAGERLGTSHVE